jgi:hypothetical protein
MPFDGVSSARPHLLHLPLTNNAVILWIHQDINPFIQKVITFIIYI